MDTKKALIVDDSRTMRALITMTLKNQGFEIIEAEHGKQALDALNNINVNIIITDLNMPEMNGIELIKALRQNSLYQGLPILIVTTESSKEKKQEGKDAGATGWIVKPFDSLKLIEVVNKVCI